MAKAVFFMRVGVKSVPVLVLDGWGYHINFVAFCELMD